MPNQSDIPAPSYAATVTSNEIAYINGMGIVDNVTGYARGILRFHVLRASDLRPDNHNKLMSQYHSALQDSLRPEEFRSAVEKELNQRLVRRAPERCADELVKRFPHDPGIANLHSYDAFALPEAILDLPQFQGNEGVARLHNIVNETYRGTPKEYALGLKWTTHEVLAGQGMEYKKAEQLADSLTRPNPEGMGFTIDEPLLAAEMRQQIPKSIKKFEKLVKDGRTAVETHAREHGASDPYTRRLTDADAKSVLDDMVKALPKGNPAADTIRSALNNPDLKVVVIDSKDVSSFYRGKPQRPGAPPGALGFSEGSSNTIYVPARSTLGTEVMLEELGHNLVRNVYQNNNAQVPYQNNQDARKDWLVDALKKDFKASGQNIEQMRKDLNLTQYNGKSFHAEAPVKIMVMKAQGTWTPELAEKYSHLDHFVDNIVLKDAESRTQAGKLPEIAKRIPLDTEPKPKKDPPPLPKEVEERIIENRKKRQELKQSPPSDSGPYPNRTAIGIRGVGGVMNAQQIGSDIHTFQDAVAKGEYGKASIALADMTANGGGLSDEAMAVIKNISPKTAEKIVEAGTKMPGVITKLAPAAKLLTRSAPAIGVALETVMESGNFINEDGSMGYKRMRMDGAGVGVVTAIAVSKGTAIVVTKLGVATGVGMAGAAAVAPLAAAVVVGWAVSDMTSSVISQHRDSEERFKANVDNKQHLRSRLSAFAEDSRFDGVKRLDNEIDWANPEARKLVRKKLHEQITKANEIMDHNHSPGGAAVRNFVSLGYWGNPDKYNNANREKIFSESALKELTQLEKELKADKNGMPKGMLATSQEQMNERIVASGFFVLDKNGTPQKDANGNLLFDLAKLDADENGVLDKNDKKLVRDKLRESGLNADTILNALAQGTGIKFEHEKIIQFQVAQNSSVNDMVNDMQYVPDGTNVAPRSTAVTETARQIHPRTPR